MQPSEATQPPKLKAIPGGELRGQPASIPIEEVIIGSILMDPTALPRVIGTLKPEHFYFSAHAEIYKAAISLYQNSQPVDLFTVATHLTNNGKLEQVGGQYQLVELADPIVTSANVDAYAEIVVKKWKRRQLIATCREIASLGFDETIDDDSLQDQTEKRLLDLFTADKRTGLRDIESIMMEELDRIDLAKTQPISTSTGFYDLDGKIAGLNEGDLIVVAGRPGSGKTAISAAIGRNVAAQGKPVALFSLEMSGGQIAQRLIASESSVDGFLLKTGNLSDSHWNSIGLAVSSISQSPIWIDESQNVSVSHIRSESRRLVAERGKLGCIIVDYLHLMLDDSDDETRELGKITRQLKKLAGELKVPIVLLSQLNRAVESRTDKRPMMSDLRQSGAIEQDADIILMLYRDEYYNEDSADKGIAEVIVAKNRNGSTGTIKLLFEPEFSRFRNLATPQESYSSPQPTTPRKPPSTPPKAPSQPKKEPAKREPQPVASEPSNHPFDDAVAESIPPMPDEVDGFRKGDRVEITLDNFDQKMQKQIRREDGFVDGQTGVVIGFKWCTIGIPAYDPIVSLDGVENKSKSFPAVYLKKIDDSECDDF